MQNPISTGLYNLVELQNFTVFPEYFIGISIIYVLIVIVLITYNVYGLMLQKSLSECVALILIMACYLIINDDFLVLPDWLFVDPANVCEPAYFGGTPKYNIFKTFHESYSPSVIFNNSIMNDYFAFSTKLVVCSASAVYFLIISNFLKEQKLTSFEYLLITLCAVLGLILLCSSNDLLTAYLSIELFSLAFYILASFKKSSIYSIESGIKYFIIGSISSAFFLLGSSFLYGISGSINFSDFFSLFENIFSHIEPECLTLPNKYFLYYFFECLSTVHLWLFVNEGCLQYFFEKPSPSLIQNFTEIGLSLILFSLLIKLALAPFHLWSLDVYEGSPTSTTFFFAVIGKFSIFVLLVRLCCFSFLTESQNWQEYLLFLGVLSIFVGCFGGLKQRKIKTLLAYSSTAHMGYVLLAFGTNTALGYQMVFFYLMIYILVGLVTWFIILTIRIKQKNVYSKYSQELGDYVLLNKSNPSLAFAFALTMFSVAGIPPIVGFLAKMNVFLALMDNYMYLIGLVSILFSVISTFYYIRVIKVLYFENSIVGKLYYPISNSKIILLSLLVILLLFFFVNPTLLYLFNYKIILSNVPHVSYISNYI